MTDKNVILTHSDDIAIITLNDPDTLNALSPSIMKELQAALDFVIDQPKNVRCVVVTGSGRGFSSGASLTHSLSNEDGSAVDLGSLLETTYHPFLRTLKQLHCPLITAVNGLAAGVGMSFALMGDLILAARSAYFLQAFTRIGLSPDGGSTWLLPRLIGLARAKELSLMADKLSAERALEWGLINRVYDDDQLMDETMKLARQFAKGPTLALGLTRNLYSKTCDNSFDEQLALEASSQRKAGFSEDLKEGVAAFMEKRPATFKGE